MSRGPDVSGDAAARALLEVRGLSRRYGATPALERVDLDLTAGQVLGLVGPNGAGKTTLLRILATLDYPTGGQALLSGADIVADPERVRPWIGYMPEAFGLYDELTVFEYLDVFARLQGSAARALADVVELTDLGTLAHVPVRVLSRGVRQRVFLARTLLSDPKLLLLDEPSAGLDPRARSELGGLLRELARLGKAIIISSHVLSELEGLADQLAVMERGRLVYSGPPRAAGAEFAVAALVLERPDDFVKLVTLDPAAVGVTQDGDRIAFCYRGPARALAALHRRLALDGPPLVSFDARQPTLEELYFRVTKGEIQ